MASQEIFEDCYRNRQSALHHAAYLRMRKVLLALSELHRLRFSLEGKRVFDYGFGAGTFLRHLPRSTKISGVEVDPENVRGVGRMLDERGQTGHALETINIASWDTHPCWSRKYDLILCSHVLEHLTEPVSLLRLAMPCLNPGGIFLALVPVNELASDPHHEQKCDRGLVTRWAHEAGGSLLSYREDDHFTYWAQPLYTRESGICHRLAQGISILLGIPATLVGHKAWWRISAVFGKLTGSRPTQAVFALGSTGAAP